MKLFDLRLRGSVFTLGTVVSDTDHHMFRKLIDYLQCGANEEDEVPNVFFFTNKCDVKRDTFPLYQESDYEELGKWVLDEGYCTESGGQYTFTGKALDVFQKTIDVDEKLAATGFSYCPCSCQGY